MKVFIVLIPLLLMLTAFNHPALHEARVNYNKAAHDKDVCKQMIDKLENASKNSALNLAYLGGFQTIWANHVFNPIDKLKTFKQGKKNIEQAINKEPGNVEIRFIRLSIQKHAPIFLGYHTNIQEDRDFIIKHRNDAASEVLQKNIEALLK